MHSSKELKSIIDKSLINFKGITKADWVEKFTPTKWSRLEVLGHLIDSAQNNLRRFVVTQYEQKQKIVYAQNEWVTLQNYQQSDPEDIINLWRLLNLHIIRVIDNMPEGKLLNVCDTGKVIPQLHTIEFLITDYISHLKHHLTQIIK